MTDETEVVDSNHTADEESMGGNSKKSDLYRDTEVTEQDRTVKFKNKAAFTDTSNGKSRKVRFGIDIEGCGIHEEEWLGWDTYTSPKETTIYRPEDVISVPNDGEPDHDFGVKTKYQLKEYQSGEWVLLYDDYVGPYTATVTEESSGG